MSDFSISDFLKINILLAVRNPQSAVRNVFNPLNFGLRSSDFRRNILLSLHAEYIEINGKRG